MESGEGYDAETTAARVEAVVDRTGQTPRVVLSDSEREPAWLSMDEFTACELSHWR
jgi:hypothetical protein